MKVKLRKFLHFLSFLGWRVFPNIFFVSLKNICSFGFSKPLNIFLNQRVQRKNTFHKYSSTPQTCYEEGKGDMNCVPCSLSCILHPRSRPTPLTDRRNSTHASRPDKSCRSRRPRCIQSSQVCSWISLPCPDFRGSGERSPRQRMRSPWHQLVLVHIKARLCWPASGSRLQSQRLWLHRTGNKLHEAAASYWSYWSLLLKYLHLF